MDIEGHRSKEDQPSEGFPDICFAIEDFDVAFKGLVRTRPQPFIALHDAGGPWPSQPRHCLESVLLQNALQKLPA